MTKKYVIDLTACVSVADIMGNICSVFENAQHDERDVILKLKDFQLNQSQMLSIKSLIESYGSILKGVMADSLITKQLAENMGLQILSIEEIALAQYQQEKSAISTDYENAAADDDDVVVADVDEAQIIEETKILEAQDEIKMPNAQNDEQQTKESTTSAFSNSPIEFYKPVAPQINDDFVQKTLFDENVNAQSENTETSSDEISTGEENPHMVETGEAEEVQEVQNVQNVQENQDVQEIDEVQEDEVAQETKENAQDESAQNIETAQNNENNADEEGERKTIGVYTKAYDENDTNEIYEEVDFYAPPSNEPVVVDTKQTMYINQTLRSGQVVEYDGNVLIIGDCHPGSEIKATGDITVWGVLGSIAHAGIKGNKEAKIRALKLNAVQLRIADCYSRRPDGTNIPYIVKSSSFIPEEAKIVDGNIVLYKMT